jgi:hypothetical protein
MNDEEHKNSILSEAVAFLSQQTDRTRKEVSRVLSEEVKGFLRSLDLQGEIRKALTGMTVKVRAEISFTENKTKARIT